MKFRFDGEFHVLSRQEMDAIHAASLRILSEVGVRIPNERVRRMVASVGGTTHEASETVTFSADVLERHLEQRREEARRAGERVTHYRGVASAVGSEAAAEQHVIEGHVGGLCTMAWDSDARRTRPATREDLISGTIIANHLDCVRRYTPMFTPLDVPDGTSDLHVWAITFLTSTKDPTGGYILRKQSVRPLLDMCIAYAGSEEEVRRKDLFHYLCFISSPLRIVPDALEIALEVYDLRYPVYVGLPMVVAGATGPQTFAGTLALSNAESLAGYVISHAFNTPVEYGAAPVVMDPRTGCGCYADPRRAALIAACMDLSRYYGFPMAGGHLAHTDASAPGIEAAAERVFGAMINAILGISPTMMRIGILGPGGQTGCLPQMLIDAEICSMLNAFFRGIEVSDERIALDLIKRVGIGGSFLAEEHTARHLRDELWLPSLFVRERMNDGGEQVLERAKERVREILAQPREPALPPDREGDIRAILQRAVETHGRGLS
jgi:trimethylamine--corrinoid protein Co-methyltransferase